MKLSAHFLGTRHAQVGFGQDEQAGKRDGLFALPAQPEVRIIDPGQHTLEPRQTLTCLGQGGLVDAFGIDGFHARKPPNGVVRRNRLGQSPEGFNIFLQALDLFLDGCFQLGTLFVIHLAAFRWAVLLSLSPGSRRLPARIPSMPARDQPAPVSIGHGAWDND